MKRAKAKPNRHHPEQLNGPILELKYSPLIPAASSLVIITGKDWFDSLPVSSLLPSRSHLSEMPKYPYQHGNVARYRPELHCSPLEDGGDLNAPFLTH